MLKPDLSWDREQRAFLVSVFSDLLISGGLKLRTLLFLYLLLTVATVFVCRDLRPLFNSGLFVIGVMLLISLLYWRAVFFICLGSGGRSRCFCPGWPGKCEASRNCLVIS